MSLKRISYDRAQEVIGTDVLKKEDGVHVETAYDNFVLRELLNDSLTQKQRLYIIMYYKEGLTMEEIADKCSVNKSTVSRTILRGRERMLSAVKKQAIKRLLGE